MSSQPDPLYAERMNDQDALMFHIERDPLLRSTMVGIMRFDRPPDRDRFEQALENLVRALPRFRQRAEPDLLQLAPPRWEPDPYFDLGFHFARVSAPGEGNERDLLDLAAKLGMASFDLARPLWRVVLVEGLADGGAALILKVHHSVTDAMGFFRVLGNLVQTGPDDEIAAAAEVDAGERMGSMRRVLDAGAYRTREAVGLAGGTGAALGSLLTAPVPTVRGGLRLLGSMARILRPEFSPESPLMRERSLNVRYGTLELPLDEFKASATQAGGKLNDAFLAGIAGGMSDYHARHGFEPAALRVNMPVNFRADDSAGGGNYFVPARFLPPLAGSSPRERLREIGRVVQDVRSEPALTRFDTLTGLLNRAPALSTPLFGAMLGSVDVDASNVPGPPFRLYCAGAEIERMYPFGPLAGAAVNVSVVSYGGMLYVAVNTDTAAVPDPAELVECLEQGFAEVLATARAPAGVEAG
jgi:diacylglycerol O-acyltransferase / wax synthase